MLSFDWKRQTSLYLGAGEQKKYLIWKKMKIRQIRINYLGTYDLYSPVHNVLDACIFITRASGRGLGPGI